MANGVIQKDLDQRLVTINNYNQSDAKVNFIRQSDGRLQIGMVLGADSLYIEFSEAGVIRGIKNGSVLWTK